MTTFQMDKKLQTEKISSPLGKRWVFFLQVHKNSNSQKSAKALVNLVECLFRYTTIINISDYLAHTKRHNNQSHTLVYKCLTQKRNWANNWLNCLESTWPKNETFLTNISALDPDKIINAFAKILQINVPANKKKKDISTKEYNRYLKHFQHLIPLIKFWNSYSLTYYQDFPWQQNEETTVPVLSFVGLKPKHSLQDIKSKIHGTLDKFYLCNNSNSQFLSLYPFFSMNTQKSVHFFAYFNIKKQQIEYINYDNFKKEKRTDSSIIKELSIICTFLEKQPYSSEYKGMEDIFFAKETFYPPLEKLTDYRDIHKKINRRLKKNSFNIVTCLHELLSKFFINAFLEKLLSYDILEILVQLDFSNKVLALGNVYPDLEKHIVQILETTQTKIKSDNRLFIKLYRNFLQKKSYDHLKHLMLVWCTINQDIVIEYIDKLTSEYREEVFLMILDFLLEEELNEEAVFFFDSLYCDKDLLHNKSTIIKLIKAFVVIEPQRCFDVCRLFIFNWDIQWIDSVVKDLLYISLDKTIALVEESGAEPGSFDYAKWQRWTVIYNIIHQKNDFVLLYEFINKISDSVSRLRLEGVCALSMNKIDLFMKIVSEISFSNNTEQIIGSICFFIHYLDKNPSVEEDLTDKLVEIIHTYSYGLLDFVGTYNIKKNSQKFLANIHAGDIIRIKKEFEEEDKKISLFSIYISYLIAKGFLSIEDLQKNAELITKNFLDSSQNNFQELFDLTEKTIGEDGQSYEYNTVNQLLAEMATVLWTKDKQIAIYYIEQIIPDMLFDKEDAVKKLVEAHPNIKLKELDLFSLEKYEIDRVKVIWLEKHITNFPQNIVSLYSKVDETLKNRLITKGIPLLVEFNIEEAIKFMDMIKKQAIFDFGEQMGNIFLKLYRHNEIVGCDFLLNISGWDLTHNSTVSISLLRALKKLSLRKLLSIYDIIVAHSDILYREEIYTLLLSTIVHRKPSYTFTLLQEASASFSNNILEKIVYSLISQLCHSKKDLAYQLFQYLYAKMQIKKFIIDEVSLCQIEDAVIKCMQQDKSWNYTPEICIHRWMVSPRLFSKLCFRLLFTMPERAISLANYLVGKKDIFYILGSVPYVIINDKNLDIQIEFSKEEYPSLSTANKKHILRLITLSINRLPSLEDIFPYILSPIWSEKDIEEILSLFPAEIHKELSLTNYITFMVARELSGFNRLRFESNLKYFAQKFYKKESEKIDIEKQFFPLLFKIMFWAKPKLVDEIWLSYWDQQDFIAFVLISTIDQPQKQMLWVEKIISKEDRLEGFEIIATSIVEQGFPIISGFCEECAQTIDDYGGFELVYLRVPNIFITLLELNIDIAISLINSIFDEEILASSVEFALEYLCTAKNFTQKMCKRIVLWLKNASITKCISANDLLYFYCQLVERMLDINCSYEAKKLTQEIIRLTKICQEREKRYYLEDLIMRLLDEDIELAYKIVQSYEDNEDLFVKVVAQKSLDNLQQSINMAKNHDNPEVVNSALEEIANVLVTSKPLKVFEMENIVDDLLCGDAVFGALAVASAKQKKSPHDYILKIENFNILLKVYCEIAEIYLQENNDSEYLIYQNKIETAIKGIKPSYNFLGLSLEWDSGFPVEIPNETLEKLSYLYPKSTLRLFFMYIEHDRFIDLEETLQAIFRAVALRCPEDILNILKKIEQFDLSNYQDVLQEQAKKNPKRVMSWLVQIDQTHLYPLVLDQITDQNQFFECLELALKYSHNFSKQDYINRLTMLIKYLFRIGGQSIVFRMVEVMQIFSPPPFPASIKEIIQGCIDICNRWENEQRKNFSD
ncbi:hypothetical protein [Candidatus Uabimicrobium sp. HlEnr_7]|uniref:hypothetical protein n=1 Tax=Candidatus Uabimicrobium helgolandensis TaxID=3095367 RepID=UPI003556F817